MGYLLLLRRPLSQPGLVLPQRFLESVNLSMGTTRRRSTLGFGGKILLRLQNVELVLSAVHHGVVEGFGELPDFLVPVGNRSLGTPERGNRKINERCRKNDNM